MTFSENNKSRESAAIVVGLFAIFYCRQIGNIKSSI